MRKIILHFVMLLPFIVISQEISKSNYDSVPVYSKEELKEAILNLRKNKPKKKDETYAYNKDETAPQYPGCKKGNNEKKRKCKKLVVDSGKFSQYLEENLTSNHFNKNRFFTLKIYYL